MKKINHNNFAIYKHKDGKVFLKRNGWKRFQEVELKRFYFRGQSWLRVVPISNQKELV